MKRDKDLDIDQDYWMKDVGFSGQMRGDLILHLMKLLDKVYQESEWIKNWQGKVRNPDTSFSWNLEFTAEMMFDVLGLEDHLNKSQPPTK